MTMTLIQTITVGTNAPTSIEFTNIPQDGTDLYLFLNARVSGYSIAILSIITQFNNTSTNYNMRSLTTSAGTVNSSNQTVLYGALANSNSATANTFANTAMYISNYSSTSFEAKPISIDTVAENNSVDATVSIRAALWDNVAITSLKMTPELSTTFVQDTTASLYKITKGSLPGVVVI